MKYVALSLTLMFAFSIGANAEPWMVSRFAGNGTVTCKSCHTNPNGGGLRNLTGKSAEERWLRSLYFESYRLNKPLDPSPKAAEDLARQEREEIFNGGVDFRWFYLNTKKDAVTTKGAMPMDTDLGASVKPLDHATFVWESRFASDPRTTDVWDQHYTANSSVRSAYGLVDDLPLNGYVMYGIYRPLFGNYSPDHTTLFERVSGFAQNSTFKAGTIGIAPGKAFFNVHEIEPFTDRTLDQDRGFALNAGVHLPNTNTYAMFSYWDTKARDYVADTSTHRKMTSFTAGVSKWGLTAVVDVTHVVEVTPQVRSDSGTIISVDPRWRVWRETYLRGAWEYVNTGPNLRLGHARQLGIGASTFLMSGVELELMYKELKATELDVGSREQNYWAQIHLFF